MDKKLEDKKKILDLVSNYAREYLSNINNKSYKENDKIPYSEKVFDENEVVNLVDSALDFWLTQGKCYDEFEDKLSKYSVFKYSAKLDLLSLLNSSLSRSYRYVLLRT